MKEGIVKFLTHKKTQGVSLNAYNLWVGSFYRFCFWNIGGSRDDSRLLFFQNQAHRIEKMTIFV
jgi:hypothetical protein